MRIIAVANRKGGVGKTATATNLAAGLASKGKRVLLIDVDPQGGSTVALGLNKWAQQATIYNALIEGKTISEVIKTTEIPGLNVVPANLDLDGADLELAPKMSRETVLKRLLAPVNGYDFILIDCPPNMGLTTLNALVACNEVLIPVQAEYHSLEGTADLKQTLSDIAEFLGHKPKRRFLVTMVSRATKHSAAVIEILREQFGEEVYLTVIPRNVAVAKAPSFGKPAVLYAPDSPGAKAYFDLVEEVLNVQ
jgi:chromosome partitioning protein